MECKHERYKCRNNHFICCSCGAEIADPFKDKETHVENQNGSEGAKKPVKRRGKKGE